MEAVTFSTPNTPWTHMLREEGHLFRWTAERSYVDEHGTPKVETLDYGLVPGGVFVAVEHLVTKAKEV